MGDKVIQDEAEYRRCAEPFGTREEASAAISAFFEEVYAARKKHKVANVVVGVRDSVEEVGTIMSSASYGDSLVHESLCAYLYGQASSDRQAMIAGLLAPSSVTTRKKGG